MLMGVPGLLHGRGAGFCKAVLIGVTLFSAPVRLVAEDDSVRIDFDIPAQPLTAGLAAYTDVVGAAALVDRELVVGRRSAAVKGSLTPPEALRILLAGTGLAIHYAASNAFTLAPASPSTMPQMTERSLQAMYNADIRAYFADVQSTLETVLCRREETHPGRYRVGLQFWVGPSGAVRASHLLGSTGDEQRDAMLSALAQAANFAPPPANLPQPITVVLLPRPPREDVACHRTVGRR
jgi:hypothetical protein